MNMRPRHFLLLEITDASICALLSSLREIFSEDKVWTTNIHITVRGPLVRPISQASAAEWTRQMRNDTLTIGEAGSFDNPNEFVVYLRVRSEHLRAISFKPHYSKGRFGFNPHITLYKGDPFFGVLVKDFLENEIGLMTTKDFRLIPYRSGELPLERLRMRSGEAAFEELTSVGIVKKGILRRARLLTRRYKECWSESSLLRAA